MKLKKKELKRKINCCWIPAFARATADRAEYRVPAFARATVAKAGYRVPEPSPSTAYQPDVIFFFKIPEVIIEFIIQI